ncbi:MAG: diacylglycerol/lipid kinase family protein [Pyrinomonadaceae bacterium]
MSTTTNRSSTNGGPLPLVIVNPRSAAGSTKGKWAEIASDLRTHFGAFNVAFTKRHGDGIELAKRGIANGRKFIIACGGDGTINEIANGILETGEDVEMGILPSGTGGDFRRTIEMPQTMREAARALRTGETKTIDVGKVTFRNFEAETVSRFFLNVSSFGLAASIIERVKGNTSLNWFPVAGVRGRANFALSTLQEVIGPSVSRVRIKIDDGEEKTLDTVNFCVANARFFGGGMKIAPDASLADGLFDIVNIGDISTMRILLNAHMLYRGTHLGLAEVNSKKARRIEARSFDDSVEIHIETDGELPGMLPATYEVVPAALKLRVPRSVK